MAVTRDQKAQQLTELKDKMKKSQSVMFAHYIGMTVTDVSALRTKLREGKAEMKVAKKTLMRLAAKELDLPEINEDTMDGPVACIFSYEDPLSGAQIAFKFAKDHPQVELIGGVFEGKVISKEEAIKIAKIPGKTQLLGMFMAMCNGPLSSFARALSEIAKQKEAPTPAPVAEVAPTPETTSEAAPAPVETPAAEPATSETAAPASSESSDSSASSESSETPPTA